MPDAQMLAQYGFNLVGVGHVIQPTDVLKLFPDVPRRTVYRWLTMVPLVPTYGNLRLYKVSDVAEVFSLMLEKPND